MDDADDAVLLFIASVVAMHQANIDDAVAEYVNNCIPDNTGVRADSRTKDMGKRWTHLLRTGPDIQMYNWTRLHIDQYEELLRRCQAAGLRGGRDVSSAEKLLMSLKILATGASDRDIAGVFCHSTDTVSKAFKQVLRVMVDHLYKTLVTLPPLKTPSKIAKSKRVYKPWFEHCIGALDGSHIPISVCKGEGGDDHVAYRNRKAGVSQNVLAVVDFDMNFVFALAGWEGSANDQKVIKDAMQRGALKVEAPWYYLADAGYSFNSGLTMPPYKKVRYHLQEWRKALHADQIPRTPRELFNRRHSSLRNVVERVFGVLKKRFGILTTPHQGFDVDTQVDIVYACFALHNFINSTGGDPKAESDAIVLENGESRGDDDDEVDGGADDDANDVDQSIKVRRGRIAKDMFKEELEFRASRYSG